MTDSSAKDPAALWREMVGQWEKTVNTLATGYMATNEFSREANRVMSASRQVQKGMQDIMGRYFDALNLPTKTDIDGLGERLHVIEDELGRVSAAIEQLAGPGKGPAGGVPRVPRTKRFAAKGENDK